jgi:hypothetical protein
MWEPRRLTTLWDSTACYRDSFTFIFFIIVVVVLVVVVVVVMVGDGGSCALSNIRSIVLLRLERQGMHTELLWDIS